MQCFGKCMAVASVLAFAVSAQAQDRGEWINLRTGEISPAMGFEAIPDAVAPAVDLLSSQARAAGVVATGTGADAVVYESIVGGPEFGIFLNMAPTTGLAYPGTVVFDNMGLEGGFQTGGAISGYMGRWFRSSADPRPELADFHVELWDGDPFFGVDTVGDGYAGAVIAGTEADFVDIPPNFRFNGFALGLKGAALGASNPTNRLWMVVSGSETSNTSPCRLGWIIGGLKPRVGNDFPFNGFGVQCDWDGQFDGAGPCCTDGLPCQIDTDPCADDTSGRGFCSDGDAESAGFFAFAGTCVGNDDEDFCSNFVASVFAPAEMTVTLQPTGNDPSGGLVAGAIIEGGKGTHAGKVKALTDAGATVVPSFGDLPEATLKALRATAGSTS